MISLILISFIYIINFSSTIKGDNSITKNIDLACDANQIYDSISYSCKNCDSGCKNENVCYSNERKSLYDKDKNYVHFDCNSCINGQQLTELDNNGNLLGLMCANTTIEGYEEKGLPFTLQTNNRFYLHVLANPLAKRYEMSAATVTIESTIVERLVDYYYNSCISGKYEKSCNYIVNQCVLSIYDENNDFCKLVEHITTNFANNLFENDL
jgi:hypothetical protein